MMDGAHGGAGLATGVGTEVLRYALATLGCGVRLVHHDELEAREELLEHLEQVFGGRDELAAAVEDAFERALQTLVVGLKQAWLLMETGGEHDYCEAFGEKVQAPFVAEAQLEGRLFLDFLDGFFIDLDTARDAAGALLGLGELDGPALFAQLLDAGLVQGGVADAAARATEALRRGLVEVAGLEEEHPIVRLGCWRDLLVDALHWHLTDVVRSQPSWSRYLDALAPERLDREEGRAIAARDADARGRLERARELAERAAAFGEVAGEILPNREWLFHVADRLEDFDETVESDLLKGRAISAHDLPKIVATALRKLHEKLGTSPVGRLADALVPPAPAIVDIARRAKRDLGRCHWAGEEYGEAALQLAGILVSSVGPQAAERYYREAAAFGADPATVQYGLHLVALVGGDLDGALIHLVNAANLAPDRFMPFDFARYMPKGILGAGGSGPTFLVERQTEGGEPEDCVIKVLWDRASVVDPRPSLRPLGELARAGVPGVARIVHLGAHLREFPYVVTAHVEGDDLEGFREVHGGRVKGSVAAAIGAQVAATLERMHAAGLVHRNLSPRNVRVGAGEEGLEATLLDACVPNVLLAAPGRVGGVRRLLAWARVGRSIAESFGNVTAPEVIQGGLEQAGAPADVYGLGVVLYRLATGAWPRPADPESLPRALRGVVLRCLARDPAERPAAAEVRALLEAAAAQADEAPRAAAAQVSDPFAAQPGPAAPFGQAEALGDPFAAPGADPFAVPGADPFGAPGADPFAAPGADPFAAPGADPFATPGADPFAAAPGADPFAPGAGADPFGAGYGAGADPFAAAPGADPFGAGYGAGADPFAAAPGADPFALPSGFADPFGGPAADPFAAPQGLEEDEEEALDPSEALALLENLIGPSTGAPKAPAKKPPAAPPKRQPPAAQRRPSPPAGGDPFAAAGGDPFAAAAGDPFAAASGDPFAAAAGDPFAAAAGDPFAAAAGDPFAAAAGDPFAAAGGVSPGGLWLSSEEPAAPPGGAPPMGAGGLWLSTEEDAGPTPDLAVPAEAVPAPSAKGKAPPAKGKAPAKAAPARSPKGKPASKALDDSYGLVISGLTLQSKKDAAVQILMQIHGISEGEAKDQCRSAVVVAIKKGTKDEVDAAEALFKAQKINCRVTSKKKRD